MNTHRMHCTAAMLLLALLAAGPSLAQHSRGHVDGSVFTDLLGEEAITVEVNLTGSLLKALSRADADLEAAASGLESIQALIFDVSKIDNRDPLRRATDALKQIERRLAREGWERMARVREDETDLAVMVLSDGEFVEGLVVLGVDRDEGNVIFANIAGRIDFAALEEIGDGFDIPGLEQ